MDRRVLVVSCAPPVVRTVATAATEACAVDGPDRLAAPPREVRALADLLSRRRTGVRVDQVLDRDVVPDIERACRNVSSAIVRGEPYAAVFVDRAALAATDPAGDLTSALHDLWLADPDLRVVVVGDGGATPASASDDRLIVVANAATDADALAGQVLDVWNGQAQRCRRLRARLRRLRRRNHDLRRCVARHRRHAERLRHSALHDTLTGLPNRALMMDRLNRCIARAARDESYTFAVLFVDIDDFKFINDSLGHQVGDSVLLEVASRLTQALRRFDTVSRDEEEEELASVEPFRTSLDLSARLGGDEFVVLLDGIASSDDALRVSGRLQQLLAEPVSLPGRELRITASLGIALGRGSNLSAAALLREADTAMYRAKISGGGQQAVFDSAMHAAATERLSLESALRSSLEQEELEVLYQPIVSLRRFRVQGFEALLRWNRPEFGTVGPSEFIPMAEETGLIVPIQRWVMQRVMRQLELWNRGALESQRVWVSVNVSGHQLEEAGFAHELVAEADSRALDMRLLKLELKQSCARRISPAAMAALGALRDRGVQVCIDDYGSVPSSLAELRQFPVDLLKIDRGVANTVETARDWAAVVQAMTTLAHALRKRVVVEGIETSQQMQQVDRMACDYAQGYFFARPLSAGDATKFILSPPTWRLSA